MKQRIGEPCKCVASEQMSEMSLPLGKYLKLHRKHLQITEKSALLGTPVLELNRPAKLGLCKELCWTNGYGSKKGYPKNTPVLVRNEQNCTVLKAFLFEPYPDPSEPFRSWDGCAPWLLKSWIRHEHKRTLLLADPSVRCGWLRHKTNRANISHDIWSLNKRNMWILVRHC